MIVERDFADTDSKGEFMNNSELKEILYDMIQDEDILDQMIILEGDEFADGVIGITNDYHVVYSYERLVQSLAKAYKEEDQTDEEAELAAMEWIDYNTIRSLPYMEKEGLVPIIMFGLEY